MSNFHLLPDGPAWKLTAESGEPIFAGAPSKDEALVAAIQYVTDSGGSLKIHKEDGTLAEERHYPRADDPADTLG